MGQCASHTLNISSRRVDVKIIINSANNAINFQDKTADARSINDVYPRNRVSFSARPPTFVEEKFSSDYLSLGSLSSTESTEKPDTTCCAASESFTSSVESYTLSDSNSAEFVSFDGLNERATCRNDIGLEILKAKIHFGADPQRMTTHGDRSCLMFAVIANDYNFTKDLVEQGVDVNKRTRIGETALGLAIELKRDKIASFLRLKGAKQ